MGPVSLRVSYRPLRLGWCIEADDLDHFTKAVALSHVFWGGRYNPIIPCSNGEMAEALIRAFNVDALYNISGTGAVDNFIKEFPYIQWPDFHPQLFVERGAGAERQPTLLDVAHPAQHLYESHVDRRGKPAIDGAPSIHGIKLTHFDSLFWRAVALIPQRRKPVAIIAVSFRKHSP